jgi:hypothetical protein
MTKFELVIAGGGMTVARAIKSYRGAGGVGQIAWPNANYQGTRGRQGPGRPWRTEHAPMDALERELVDGSLR